MRLSGVFCVSGAILVLFGTGHFDNVIEISTSLREVRRDELSVCAKDHLDVNVAHLTDEPERVCSRCQQS
jgi:hypothetical protein